MKIPKSFKGVPIVVLICILISSILTAYAYIQWSKTFTWEITTQTFGVYQNAAHTIPWTEGISEVLPESPVVIGSTITKDFYITNEGNVPVNVSPSETGKTGTFTPSWNGTLTLAVNQNGTLRLIFGNIQTGGSYTFQFSAS